LLSSEQHDFLERRLQNRPENSHIVQQGKGVSHRISQAARELERSLIADQLNASLYNRPEVEEASRYMVNEHMAPGLRDTARQLQRSITADQLNAGLMNRPHQDDLRSAGILKHDPSSHSSRIQDAKRQLELSMTQDKLGHLLERRSDVENLVTDGLHKSLALAPALHGPSEDLKKSLAKSNLYHALKYRPSVVELMEKGILPYEFFDEGDDGYDEYQNADAQDYDEGDDVYGDYQTAEEAAAAMRDQEMYEQYYLEQQRLAEEQEAQYYAYQQQQEGEGGAEEYDEEEDEYAPEEYEQAAQTAQEEYEQAAYDNYLAQQQAAYDQAYGQEAYGQGEEQEDQGAYEEYVQQEQAAYDAAVSAEQQREYDEYLAQQQEAEYSEQVAYEQAQAYEQAPEPVYEQGHSRRSKNFHLTRILLKFVASMAQAGEISLEQKGFLKDLIVDQDQTILAVAETFDAENDLHDFKDSLLRLASR